MVVVQIGENNDLDTVARIQLSGTSGITANLPTLRILQRTNLCLLVLSLRTVSCQ